MFRKRVKRKPKLKGGFKSKLEVSVFENLKKRKARIRYEGIKFSYTLRRNYVPDIEVSLPGGGKRYIEVKGYLRPEDRAKMIAVKRDNPEIDIRFLFAKDNKITRSKLRYSDWAKKYGFEYAIGEVPKEWLR